MRREGVVSIGVLILIAVVLALAAFFAFRLTSRLPIPSPNPPGTVACTMEAKLCPDGSYVGRVPPSCAFASCPPPTPSPGPGAECSGPGGRCPVGYACIQDCGPPVVREGEPPPPYHCVTNDVASKPRMCPICLASNTEIATPDGNVNVRDLKQGMQVWSLDRNGVRIASSVIAVSHTPVPKTHHVIHLILFDGREFFVSPGHPTADGRRVGDLQRGDRYDGARIQSADSVPYWDSETYDLLPDSDTGFYWANGILLGSTFTRP
jgi:hypothetical protein